VACHTELVEVTRDSPLKFAEVNEPSPLILKTLECGGLTPLF